MLCYISQLLFLWWLVHYNITSCVGILDQALAYWCPPCVEEQLWDRWTVSKVFLAGSSENDCVLWTTEYQYCCQRSRLHKIVSKIYWVWGNQVTERFEFPGSVVRIHNMCLCIDKYKVLWIKIPFIAAEWESNCLDKILKLWKMLL